MNVGVSTDSGSGITPQESAELGIRVVPMPFRIDDQEYYENINLTREEFFEKLKNDHDIATSQPSMEDVMKVWDELLETCDQIVHVPLSSGLSGSTQTAMMLAEDYDGKVCVVNNQRISVTQRQSVLDAVALAAAGLSAAQIREVLERTKMESSIYVTVDTLKYLKKGGRITPAAAALGTLLKIKPVLQIQGEKLDSFSKARTMKQAKSTMLSAAEHDLKTRYNDPEAENTWLEIAYSFDREAAEEFAAEVQAYFPKNTGLHIAPLSLSVACHIGPGSLAIACAKKLDIEAERKNYGV